MDITRSQIVDKIKLSLSFMKESTASSYPPLKLIIALTKYEYIEINNKALSSEDWGFIHVIKESDKLKYITDKYISKIPKFIKEINPHLDKIVNIRLTTRVADFHNITLLEYQII